MKAFQHLAQLRQEEEGEQHDDDQTNHPDDGHRGHTTAAECHACRSLQDVVQAAEQSHDDQKSCHERPGIAGYCQNLFHDGFEHRNLFLFVFNRYQGTRQPAGWRRWRGSCQKAPPRFRPGHWQERMLHPSMRTTWL